MEGYWKFLGGGGVLKAKILGVKYEAKLEFPGGGGGGMENKNPSVGEYGYFLELHNVSTWIGENLNTLNRKYSFTTVTRESIHVMHTKSWLFILVIVNEIFQPQ